MDFMNVAALTYCINLSSRTPTTSVILSARLRHTDREKGRERGEREGKGKGEVRRKKGGGEREKE